MRRTTGGFVMPFLLLFLGVVFTLTLSRAQSQLALARQVRAQTLRATALALAEGAVEEARAALEAGPLARGATFEPFDEEGKHGDCVVTDLGPGNRVVLEAHGGAGTPLVGLLLRVELELEDSPSGRRTRVTSWRELPLP